MKEILQTFKSDYQHAIHTVRRVTSSEFRQWEKERNQAIRDLIDGYINNPTPETEFILSPNKFHSQEEVPLIEPVHFNVSFKIKDHTKITHGSKIRQTTGIQRKIQTINGPFLLAISLTDFYDGSSSVVHYLTKAWYHTSGWQAKSSDAYIRQFKGNFPEANIPLERPKVFSVLRRRLS